MILHYTYNFVIWVQSAYKRIFGQNTVNILTVHMAYMEHIRSHRVKRGEQKESKWRPYENLTKSYII